MDYKTLGEIALEARKNAVAPFSNFHVGAALLTVDNTVYTGCNIESSSYSLTICAERTAIFKAISEGVKNFKAIAIASDETGYTPPCGACRQVIKDLCGDIDVVLIDHNSNTKVMNINEMLPLAFGNDKLKGRDI